MSVDASNPMVTRLMDVIRSPDPSPYLFEVRQKVRVRKGVSRDGQTPEHWDGAVGTVRRRYASMIHKEHWYEVLDPATNTFAPFREDDLDYRYARKPKEAPDGR